MPDNIDDEPLDNSTNTESEKPSDEIILTKDTEAINSNQEIENMEIHPHAHHEGKKNWKSYFWEFLMLFLAVFCGFLAENKLEHVIEDQREVKYIRSLIQDLQSDTANLQSYIDSRLEKRIMMDSLITLLSTSQYKQSGNETYYFARFILTGSAFVSTDGTMQQLKNAGNLRLIKNEKAVKSILAYDAQVKLLWEWDGTDTRVRESFREIGGSIFKADAFYHTMDANMNIVRPNNNPKLITDDPNIINMVVFQVQNLSLITQGNVFRSEDLKASALNLIDLLKKEYEVN